MFSVNRVADVLGDESQKVQILVSVERALTVALDRHDTQNLVVASERNSQPDRRSHSDQLDFPLVCQLPVPLLVRQQRPARAADIVGQALLQPQRGQLGRLVLVDVEGERVQTRLLVVECNVEVRGVEQRRQLPVHGCQESVQIARRTRFQKDPQED